MADDFETACDRVSQTVDAAQFERIRWARTEGPMLDHMVALARETVAERPDFELAEEGSSPLGKRFIIKVHGFRIAALNLGLEHRTVEVWGEAIERSKYKLTEARRQSADYDAVDSSWMKAAIGTVLGEIF